MDMQNSAAGNVIAVFDFDGTLVESDSFFPFLGFMAGWPRTAAVFVEALALFVSKRWQDKNDLAIQDHRTFIKDHLLRKLLTGKAVSALPAAIGKLRSWRRWKEKVRESLLHHHASGHHVVIASGGLDLYLPGLLEDLPYHALICTEVGITDGIINGEMISGNCVRIRKAELVAEYIAKNGPYTDGWGYGNLPHDLPMLNLLQHRIII